MSDEWNDATENRIADARLRETECELLGDDPAEIDGLQELDREARLLWSARNALHFATDHTIDATREHYAIQKNDVRARIVALAETIIEKEIEK